jgi:hypothetical protein
MKTSRMPSPFKSPHANPPLAPLTPPLVATEIVGPETNTTSCAVTTFIPSKSKKTPSVNTCINLFIFPPRFVIIGYLLINEKSIGHM